MNLSVFQKLGDIVLSSKRRVELEYEDFFKFYRALVEITDSEVAKAVGGTSITVVLLDKKEETYKLELTATDYLWWKEKVAVGLRFKFSMEAVKAAILGQMTKAAETNKLTAEERKQILSLFDEPQTVK